MQENRFAHRKSGQKLRLVDEHNSPLGNRSISYQLENHEFLFGMGAFDTLPATAEETGEIAFYQDRVVPRRSFYQERADKLTGTFNYGTLPFYWGGYEPREGQPLTQSRMDAARYLQSKGVRVKGHPLCWHSVCADWLMEYDNKTILRKQLDRIQREVSTFRGVIDMWDVINEVVIMPVYDRYDNAITRICREYGQVELVKMVFDAAKAANPQAVLLINDFNLSDKYRELIARCLDAGAPIGAIGLQTHQHQGYHGKAWFEEVIGRFSGFGLPLHFTENTLLSGHLMPPEIVDLNDYQVDRWPSTPEGEERQRREWKELYETLFAAPAVQAVTGWDLADGAWLHAPSGLLREDNTEKPAYRELHHMIHETWNSAGVLHTDAQGFAELEGFRGSYRLDGGGHSARFALKENDGGVQTIVLKENKEVSE